MNLLNIIKLSRILTKLEQIATDKGVLTIEKTEVGAEVYAENDGNVEPAKDGDYTLEDKRVMVVKDGKIADIKEPAATDETTPADNAPTQMTDEEEKKDEKKDCMEGEDTVPAETETPKEDEKDARIKELEAEIAEKAAEIESLKAEIETLKSAPVEEKMSTVKYQFPFKTYYNK